MNGHNRPAVVLDVRVVVGAGGGPEKTILNSPRFLESAGYHNLCVYLHPPGDAGVQTLRERARYYRAPFVSIPDRGPWDWRVVVELLNLCRRARVAIYHGHDYKSNLLGLLLWRFHSMRLVTTLHGWVQNTTRTPLYYAIDRWTLPRYEQVLCVSTDLHAAALACGVPAERCFLVENGIDTEEYRRLRSVDEAKARFGVPPARVLIGAVGRLSAEKGFDLLIRAVNRLVRTGLDIELWIAGDGAERGQLKALASSLGCADRVRLLGYRNDTMELYHAMDVYALSSLREGLPNVLLEAMALEVPVVSTRIAGIPRLVTHGENGLLIAPGSEDELTNALATLLTSPDLRRRLASAARHTIETRFSFASRMDKVRGFYDQLLGRSAVVRSASEMIRR
jgi:glycosyltransferase involved in cell wall biosynthesis